jgi:hypothetical protein
VISLAISVEVEASNATVFTLPILEVVNVNAATNGMHLPAPLQWPFVQSVLRAL